MAVFKFDTSLTDRIYAGNNEPLHTGGIFVSTVPAGHACGEFLVHAALSQNAGVLVSKQPFTVSVPGKANVMYATREAPERYVFPPHLVPSQLLTLTSPDLADIKLELQLGCEKRYLASGTFIMSSAGPFCCAIPGSKARATPFARAGGRLRWISLVKRAHAGEIDLYLSANVEIVPLDTADISDIRRGYEAMVDFQKSVPLMFPGAPRVVPLDAQGLTWNSELLEGLRRRSAEDFYGEFIRIVQTYARLSAEQRKSTIRRISQAGPPEMLRLFRCYTTIYDSLPAPSDSPASDAPSGSPTTDAPAGSTPASSAPATDAPAIDAPATDAPASSAPAADAPASSAPASAAPASSTPASSAPVANKRPASASDVGPSRKKKRT